MSSVATSSALAVFIDDLQRNGVSELLADVPYDWFATTAVAPKKTTSPPPVVHLAQPKQAQKSAPKVTEKADNVADWLHLEATAGCLLLVAPDEGLSVSSSPMSRDEYELLCKIIRAAGVENTPLGWLRLQHEAADPTPLAPPVQQALNAAVVKAVQTAAPCGVILLGGAAVRSVFGRGVAMDEARTQALALPEGLAAFTVQATYHPAVLLQDPLLKRAAWQDWLSLACRLQAKA